MLRFLAKSLLRKYFVLFLFFGTVLWGFYFLNPWDFNSWQLFAFFSIWLFLFFLLTCLYFFYPLRVVLLQIQSLLSGKPYRKIFTYRIDEIGILAYFFNKVTEGFDSLTADIRSKDRMMQELLLASQLQRDILPDGSPKVPFLQVVAKNKPASELGGDSFNFITKGDRTYFYVGDVTGHGAAAGILMTMVHALLNVFSEMFTSPYVILVNVNNYIRKWVKKAMYMTLVLLCWDSKEKKMSFVGAGHEHILIYRASSGVVDVFKSGGLALGMVPDNSKIIKEQELLFNDGDFLLLYSDGITEAKNSDGEFYGLDRLKTAFSDYAAQYSPEGVNYHIARDVSDFIFGTEQLDDMTLIVIRRDDKMVVGEEKPVVGIHWS